MNVGLLYRNYGTNIYRCCYRYLKNREDALDARQEVFLRVLRNAEKCKSEEGNYSWIRTIAQNYCKDVLRDRKKAPMMLEECVSDMYHVISAPTCLAEESSRYWTSKALEGINPTERYVVWLHLWEELSAMEIYRMTGVGHRVVLKMLKKYQSNVFTSY